MEASELLSAARSSLSKATLSPFAWEPADFHSLLRGMSQFRGPPDILRGEKGRDLDLSAWWWCQAGEPAGRAGPLGVGAQMGATREPSSLRRNGEEIIRERERVRDDARAKPIPEWASPGDTVGSWVKLKAVGQSETKPGRFCYLLHKVWGPLLGSPSSS